MLNSSVILPSNLEPPSSLGRDDAEKIRGMTAELVKNHAKISHATPPSTIADDRAGHPAVAAMRQLLDRAFADVNDPDAKPRNFLNIEHIGDLVFGQELLGQFSFDNWTEANLRSLAAAWLALCPADDLDAIAEVVTLEVEWDADWRVSEETGVWPERQVQKECARRAELAAEEREKAERDAAERAKLDAEPRTPSSRAMVDAIAMLAAVRNQRPDAMVSVADALRSKLAELGIEVKS